MTARAIGWSGAFIAATAIWATVIAFLAGGGLAALVILAVFGLGVVGGWLLAAAANCRGRAG